MKKYIRFPFVNAALALGFLSVLSVSCKEKDISKPEKLKETIVEGSTTMLVDETILPIVEDQAAVFETQYHAKIKLISKPESEVVNDLITDKAKIAILSRTLNSQEETVFKNKEIKPRITKFAIDAVTLITNNQSKDTLVDLQEIIHLMQGKKSKVKGLVFENSNSSTVKYMSNLAGITAMPKENIYALKSHSEVFRYISERPDLIGVVGLNTIVQPTKANQDLVKNIKVMAVKNLASKPNSKEYYKPSQSNLAEGLYPLHRDLYMLNYQGSAGLGMGFASFVAGENGQRIVLKSGLMPVRLPGRSLNIRKEILNTKQKK